MLDQPSRAFQPFLIRLALGSHGQSRFPAFFNSLWLWATMVQLVQVNTHGAKAIFFVWHSLAKAFHLHVHDLFCGT